MRQSLTGLLSHHSLQLRHLQHEVARPFDVRFAERVVVYSRSSRAHGRLAVVELAFPKVIAVVVLVAPLVVAVVSRVVISLGRALASACTHLTRPTAVRAFPLVRSAATVSVKTARVGQGHGRNQQDEGHKDNVDSHCYLNEIRK